MKIRNLLLLVLMLSSCNHINPSESPSLFENTFIIEVIDIDGTILSTKNLDIDETKNLFDILVENFNVDYSNGEYGPYINSIDNSVIDNNYYVAIYENEVLASSAIDKLLIDKDDVFTFKVECWNTLSSNYGILDDYDVLIDKIIYSYYKNLDLSNLTSYLDGAYWDLLAIDLAMSYNYDNKVFNFTNLSESIKTQLNEIEYTSLANADFLKCFMYLKAFNLDYTDLKNHLFSYLDLLDDTYNPYASPFVVSVCKKMNINHEKIDALTQKEISLDLSWGPDASVWQFVTSILYNENISKDILNNYVVSLDYGNSASCAIVLQAFAAMNIDVRSDEYQVDQKDLIEVLIDNYYNYDSNIIEYSKGVENTFSYNQVMASLLAYKITRDTKEQVNIYG